MVGPIPLDEVRQPVEGLPRGVAQSDDSPPRVLQSFFHQAARALDHGLQLLADLLALAEAPRALQLDRQAGEGLRQYIVQIAGDPGPLSEDRRPGLGVAGILQPGEQHLGALLVLSGPAHAQRHDREYRAERQLRRRDCG